MSCFSQVEVVTSTCLCCSEERNKSKPASSEQIEELQIRTTNIGLQLRKQMNGTSDNIGTVDLCVQAWVLLLPIHS